MISTRVRRFTSRGAEPVWVSERLSHLEGVCVMMSSRVRRLTCVRAEQVREKGDVSRWTRVPSEMNCEVPIVSEHVREV